MRFFSLAILASLMAGNVFADQGEETIVRDGTLDQDAYVIGARVRVNADAKGDVVAAGGKVSIDGEISGDLLVAGGEVSVEANVDDDVRLAGGQISLCSEISGDAVLAGADINVCNRTKVNHNSFMVGKDVIADGRFDGNLTVKGGHITLAGEVGGDVDIQGHEIELLPSAVIDGNLHYSSPNPATIHAGATVRGEEQYTVSERRWWRESRPSAGALVGLVVIGIVGLTLAAMILTWLFPTMLQHTTQIVHTETLPSLGVGLVTVLLTPVMCVLLLITVIGAPAAFALVVAFLSIIFIGFYSSLIGLAGAIASLLKRSKPLSRSWQVLTLLLASLSVALIGLIPVLGGIALFLFYLTGVGAVVRFLIRSRQAEANYLTNE